MSSSKSKTRLLILASGRGSNFAALCRAIEESKITGAEIVALICNKKNAGVLALAETFKVKAVLVESKGKTALEYERALMAEMRAAHPDLVCLAGYMKILSDEVIRAFSGKIINIHPSLLPQFRGLHAQRQALQAGVKETGCTVHWVTETLDDGPIIEQARLTIDAGETEASLTSRLLELEHATYVRALARVIADLAK